MEERREIGREIVVTSRYGRREELLDLLNKERERTSRLEGALEIIAELTQGEVQKLARAALESETTDDR